MRTKPDPTHSQLIRDCRTPAPYTRGLELEVQASLTNLFNNKEYFAGDAVDIALHYRYAADKAVLTTTLRRTKGSQSQACKLLNMSRSTMYSWCQRLEVYPDDFKLSTG